MSPRRRLADALISAMVRYWSSPRRRAGLAPSLARILRAYIDDPDYPRHFETWQSHGVHVTADHFYSPIPNTRTIDAGVFSRR